MIAGTPDIPRAVIIIAAIIFAIATFINTNIGLIAILLSMLLSPELEAGAAADRAIVVRAEDLLLIIVSITWLARMAVRKAPLIRQSPLNVPIGLYIAVMAFSTIRGMAAGDITPVKGTFYVLKLVEYFVLFFIVLNQTTTEKQVKMFLTVLFLTSIVVGIYGNTHIGAVERISAPFEGEGEPNTLGGYILFILSILGGLIYCYGKRRHILILVFLFLIPTFLFTLSRASYLGMFASLVAFTAISKSRKVIAGISILALAFVLAVAFGPQVLKDRVLGTFQPEEAQALKRVGPVALGPSPAARVESWHRVLTTKVPRKPFFGGGVTGIGFLDSQYILALGETGFIGLFLFLWIMWRIWRTAYHTYYTVEKPEFKGLTLGYIAGFAGLLFHAIGSNTFVIIRIAEPFWFFTAIVIKLVDIETGKAAIKERRMR